MSNFGKKHAVQVITLMAFVFVLAACGRATFGDTTQLARESAEQFMEAYSVPGLTIALVDAENGFTWTYGFGYADSVNRVPVTEETLFAVASISKPFTAIAVMQLILNAISAEDERLLIQSSVMQMVDFDLTNTDRMAFGLGFSRRVSSEGLVFIGHEGWLRSYFSDMVFDLESGIGVFVAVNSASGFSVATPLAEEILQSAINEKARQ